MAPILTSSSACAFCHRVAEGVNIVAEAELAAAFEDAYPLNPGHTLILPRRHVARFAELTDEERSAIWELVPTVRVHIERQHAPDGYNVGLNEGATAGQTIAHVHLHVIPRYRGDVEDPRGGIRWIVPERAAYWRDAGDG
jgi:diadenosine tetraphosphate (Ap4A) HIT family hydrolase